MRSKIFDKMSSIRKIKETVMKTVVYISSSFVFLMILSLIGYILYKGAMYISPKFLLGTPSLINATEGILPNILNTFYIVVITLIIVLPIGVGAAIFLNEYAKNRRSVRVIEIAAETLAGIPSIIYGLVGMLIFVRFFSLGTSVLAGALTLVVMTLPTVMRTTQESLKTVPDGYREGGLALGCGKWYMIRTLVLPSAIDGIVTGCILSVGRIVGESAALLFTAGMANEVMGFIDAVTPNHPGSTLAVALYMYAKERGEFESAFAIAVMCVFIAFILNIMTKLVTKFSKRKGR